MATRIYLTSNHLGRVGYFLLTPTRPFFLTPTFPLPAWRIAIATACFCGLPLLINSLMLDETAASLFPFDSGIVRLLYFVFTLIRSRALFSRPVWSRRSRMSSGARLGISATLAYGRVKTLTPLCPLSWLSMILLAAISR